MRTFNFMLLGLVSFIALLTVSSCGVKAPPLPPEASTPQQADKGGWSPDRTMRPSPSPSPSPRQ